jgi:cyclin-A
MFIAAKFQEIYPPVLSDFVTCANNIYSAKELLDMEFRVLTVLEFDVNCTPS